MKIPYAALWWEQPKLRDGAGLASVTTVEILFQKQVVPASWSMVSRALEKCIRAKGQVGGYTFATNLVPAS